MGLPRSLQYRHVRVDAAQHPVKGLPALKTGCLVVHSPWLDGAHKRVGWLSWFLDGKLSDGGSWPGVHGSWPGV